MNRVVGFLRNVMVGRNGLTRDALLRLFADAGATAPRSYLSTGNVSFAPDRPLTALISEVEAGIEAVMGRREPLFVRTVERLCELASDEPFEACGADVYERCVTFLPDGHRWTAPLPHSSKRRDVTLIGADGLEVFSTTYRVDGRPGTAGPLVERKLGVAVTTRNWNTVMRIVRSPC